MINRIILIIAIGFGLYYIVSSVLWIAYPHSIDYGEGYVMNTVRLWANGQWDWNVNEPPYLTMPYGLGYVAIATPFAKVFGSGLWLGRTIGFISGLAICVLLYLIVLRLTGNKYYALLGALAPATQPIFRDWSVMARVDVVAVALELLGLYIFIRWQRTIMSALPFALAMMIKLSAVAGLGAVLVYLLIKDRKQMLIYGGCFVIVLLVAILPITIVTGGEYLKHSILYQQTQGLVYLPRVVYMFNQFAMPLLIFVIPAILYIKKHGFNVVALFFVVALLLNTFETFRPGSASMYYLEAVVATCLCGVMGLQYVLTNKLQKFESVAVFAVALLIFAFYAPRHNADFPNKQYTQDIEKVEQIVRQSDKLVITEISSVPNPDQLYIENFIFTNMTRKGYWDEASYIQDYEDKKFDYVLLRTPLEDKIEASAHGIKDELFTDEVMEAIDQNYQLVYQTDSDQFPYSIYLYGVK